MGNTGALPRNEENHILTPTSGKRTDAFADGKAPIVDENIAAGDGPKFRSLLDRDEEATTSRPGYAHRKL